MVGLGDFVISHRGISFSCTVSIFDRRLFESQFSNYVTQLLQFDWVWRFLIEIKFSDGAPVFYLVNRTLLGSWVMTTNASLPPVWAGASRQGFGKTSDGPCRGISHAIGRLTRGSAGEDSDFIQCINDDDDVCP